VILISNTVLFTITYLLVEVLFHVKIARSPTPAYICVAVLVEVELDLSLG
jgi:hypothetical protein